MALIFPSNPTLNQVYSTGSLSWTWNGKSWNNGTSILVTSNLVSSSVQFTNGNTNAFDTTSNITVGQITASFAKISGSIFGTASFAILAQTSSYLENSQTASYVVLAQTASYVLNAISASYSLTSSWSIQSQTASYVILAQTASYVTLSQTASFVTLAQTASYIATASYALAALSASYAPNIYVLPSNVVSASAQLSNGGGTAFSNSNNLTVGQVTASAISVTTLRVVTVTSSIDYASGSNIFGTKSTDTQLFTGSVSMSGSLGVMGLTTINSNSSALTAGPATTLLQVGGADSTNTRVTVDSFAGVPVFSGRRANGTNASKTAVVSGNIISSFSAFGYGSTAYSSGAGGFMGFTAAENWTDTAIGTNASITLVPTGSTAQTTSFVFYNNGNLSVPSNVGIGTASPAAKLHISGTNAGIIFDRITTDVDPSGGQGSIWVKENGISNYEAMMFRATGYRWQSDDGTDRMLINSGGNVGIGTSTTTKRLHIYSGESAVGASQFNVEGYIGGYGAGITFTSLLSSTSTLKEMARITADGEAAWNATASTQDAGLRFYTTSQGTTAERMRINSAGNVGIGTASPSGGRLVVYDGSQPPIAWGASSNLGFLSWNSTDAVVRSTNNLRIETNSGSTVGMFINTSGNVGIGTTSPIAKLDVNGNGRFMQNAAATTGAIILRQAASDAEGAFIQWVNNANAVEKGWLTVDTSSNMKFATVSTERMRIDSSGNLLVGTTSVGIANNIGTTIESSGLDNARITVNHSSTGSSNGSYYMQFGYGGSLIGSISQSTTSAVSYNSTSDYRLKEITGLLTDSGTFIDGLKPKVGTWKADGSKFVGFIAHEFAEVSPSSVVGEKDAVDADGKPVYQAMQASSAEVIANLVAELQSVRQRLAALEAK